MSEHSTERQHPARRVGIAVATVLALGAAIKYGPEAFEALTTDPSLIVAGAPGQIETWDSSRVWTGRILVNKYWLGIEQCPSDVEAARRGEITQSFNPDLGAKNPACNFDWVKVNADTISSITLGSSIVFEGPVGEPLRK